MAVSKVYKASLWPKEPLTALFIVQAPQDCEVPRLDYSQWFCRVRFQYIRRQSVTRGSVTCRTIGNWAIRSWQTISFSSSFLKQLSLNPEPNMILPQPPESMTYTISFRNERPVEPQKSGPLAERSSITNGSGIVQQRGCRLQPIEGRNDSLHHTVALRLPPRNRCKQCISVEDLKYPATSDTLLAQNKSLASFPRVHFNVKHVSFNKQLTSTQAGGSTNFQSQAPCRLG